MMNFKQARLFAFTCMLSSLCFGGTTDTIFSNNRLCDILSDLQISQVAIIGCGDSNQLFGGDGWDAGWQYGLSQYYTMRETGLLPWVGSNGVNHSMGEGYSIGGDSAWLSDPFPTWINAFRMTNFGISYTESQSPLISNNHSFTLLSSSWNLSDSYRYHVTYFDSQIGPAFLRLNSRLYGSWQQLSSVVYTSLGNQSIQHATYDVSDLPQGSAGVEFKIGRFNQPDIQGPVGFLYSRVENLSRPTGFGFTSLYATGGAKSSDCLTYLQNLPPKSVELFKQENGHYSKSQLVILNFGLNDRNFHTPEEYVTNMEGIISWFRTNFGQSKLHFLIIASHPVSTPNDPRLNDYHIGLVGLASRLPRTTVLNISKLVSADEMLQNGFYTNPVDHNHLSRTGYLEIARLAAQNMALLEMDFCQGDTDNSNIVDFKDIVNILAHFSVNNLDIVTGEEYTDSSIDVNFDGVINFGDITLVMSKFGNNCNEQ